MVCLDCGERVRPLGYTDGIRDYFLPRDPPWRRRSQIVKSNWLNGGDDPYQCPECCFVGLLDDFDCIGADNGNLFCNECGAEFDPV